MSKPKRARFVALTQLLAHRRPGIGSDAIVEGRVLVDGRVIANPAARVRADASLRVTPTRRLRGDIKLSHALADLDVPVADRVAVDVGASAGGFTTALLRRGARRVYAVEVGVGQLRGSLRADPRVVNLEGTNLAHLGSDRVPEEVGLITMDLSYLAAAAAVAQLEALDISSSANLVVLVKPTFELRRGELAVSAHDVAVATDSVILAARGSSWHLIGESAALRTGRRGAVEVFLHFERRSGLMARPWSRTTSHPHVLGLGQSVDVDEGS